MEAVEVPVTPPHLRLNVNLEQRRIRLRNQMMVFKASFVLGMNTYE